MGLAGDGVMELVRGKDIYKYIYIYIQEDGIIIVDENFLDLKGLFGGIERELRYICQKMARIGDRC